MTTTPFELAVIDFDGTVCATQPAILHCMRATLAAHTACAPSDASIEAVISRGIGLADSFTELAGRELARTPSLLPHLIAAYRERYAAEGDALTTMFPGWPQTLQALRTAGIRTAVVSNKGIAAVQSALDRFALAPFVELVVGDRPGVPKKPDPALFADVLRPVFPTVATGRILVVGDTDLDIRFARNIGARSCWVSYGYGDTATCMSLEPDCIVPAASELLPILVPAQANAPAG